MKFLKFLCVIVALVALGSPAWALEDVKQLTFQSAAGATGNGTANPVDRYSSLSLQVVISDTATVAFEATTDGTNWVSTGCSAVSDTTGALVTGTSASGLYQCNVAGLGLLRVRISDWTAGTVTVTGTATTAVIGKRGGSGSGWPGSSATKIITWANSDANGVCIGESSLNCVNIFWDAAYGARVQPKTAADVFQLILNGFTGGFYDEENDCWVLRIDPDAASPNAAWTFTCSATKPKKSIGFLADSFYMQGCTLTTDSALITAGLTEPYITCGDNNAHGFHRTFRMPKSWDGGTLTFAVDLTNVNATPANDYEIDFSAECVANSGVIGTTISTTGEQPATFDFDNSGTCGTACAQFDRATVTTAAVTPNGSCAGGALLRVQGQIDATATTTAQVADVKIIAVTMEYSVGSLSD